MSWGGGALNVQGTSRQPNQHTHGHSGAHSWVRNHILLICRRTSYNCCPPIICGRYVSLSTTCYHLYYFYMHLSNLKCRIFQYTIVISKKTTIGEWTTCLIRGLASHERYTKSSCIYMVCSLKRSLVRSVASDESGHI